MGRILIGALIGLLLGAAATYYLFLGVPKAASLPGAPIERPDTSAPAAGTAQIVLRQDLFNDVLSTIFTEMSSPTFAIGSGQTSSTDSCASVVTVIPEGGGVR